MAGWILELGPKATTKGEYLSPPSTISVLREISPMHMCPAVLSSRPLQGKEQLDISVTREFETRISDKDQLSFNSSSCEQFQQSYSAFNGSTDCHNTPVFTCHRLWFNPGL
jgi:hypothetical protein